MGYSMKLELTLCLWFESILLPYVFLIIIIECWSFFLECVSLRLLYPSFTFDF